MYKNICNWTGYILRDPTWKWWCYKIIGKYHRQLNKMIHSQQICVRLTQNNWTPLLPIHHPVPVDVPVEFLMCQPTVLLNIYLVNLEMFPLGITNSSPSHSFTLTEPMMWQWSSGSFYIYIYDMECLTEEQVWQGLAGTSQECNCIQCDTNTDWCTVYTATVQSTAPPVSTVQSPSSDCPATAPGIALENCHCPQSIVQSPLLKITQRFPPRIMGTNKW